MVTTTRIFTGLALLLLAAPRAVSEEKAITRKDLPAAVAKTVDEYTEGAKVARLSTEVEHGRRVFEVAIQENGHSKDISIDSQGRVLEIEEEVALGSLSPAIQQGLRAAAGRATIGKVESLTKAGRLVAYEAVVVTAGHRREIQVGPNGERLTHRE